MATSVAKSGVLFYDGFDYETGEDALHGKGVWAEFNGGSSADVDPGSLGYVDALGNTLKTSGNHIRVDSAEELAAVEMISPAGVFSISPAGNEIWISAVMEQVNSQTNSRFFGLSLRAPDATLQPDDSNSSADEILAIGTNSSQNPVNWRIVDRATGAGTRNATTTTPSSVRCFLLARMELNVHGGLLERYTIWVKPLLDRAPSESSGFTFTSSNSDLNAWSDFNAIRIAAGHTTNPSQLSSLGLMDEVRIGDTWADVMPHEPAFKVQSVARLPDGSVQVQWNSRTDRTDVVEYSLDGQNWIPIPGSARLGPVEEVTHSYTAVPPPEAIAAQKFILRVRREF